jgi:hypothetical protein
MVHHILSTKQKENEKENQVSKILDTLDTGGDFTTTTSVVSSK